MATAESWPASPTPATLADDLRSRLEEELHRREFVPTIQRIERVSTLVPPAEWTVATDRGTTQFTFASEDDLRRLGDGRALLVDSDGMRYEIPNVEALDPDSRKILERYL